MIRFLVTLTSFSRSHWPLVTRILVEKSYVTHSRCEGYLISIDYRHFFHCLFDVFLASSELLYPEQCYKK